ncbi:hypothetical protein NM208_g6151 [Fusarium decemcellulare]|uniref:Uncharacterized protein n=1 Tax=Fusarium decemcellulare TaxID=57161 RepID=A0ACC1SEB8_9HYPO|nr:hypothetical protein NM208_g6151 [Fusarium decemcellulare]
MRWQDVTLLGFMAAGNALPSASPRNTLVQRQDDPDKCRFDRGDPSAMHDSGADTYLSDFLTSDEDQAWSTGNWLAKLDEKTTHLPDGGSYTSTLNCTQLEDRAHCQIPDQDVQCRVFTPPEVYWIRLTAPNVQTFFDAARNSLVEETLTQALNVDKLTSDFDLGDMDSRDNSPLIAAITFVISPLLGFGGIALKAVGAGAAKASEAAGIASNVAANVGGGFNLDGTLKSRGKETPLSPRDLAIAVQEVYTDFFTTTRDALKLTNEQFFKGIQQGQDDHVSAFAKGLATAGSGDFASGGSGKLDAILNRGYKMAKAQMVGAVLAAQKVVLFQNTKGDEGWCTSHYGYRWWDNSCYGFAKVKVENDGVLSSQDIDWQKVEMIESDKFGYQISVDRMMENIRDCGNDFGRKPDTSLNFDGEYPRCHFGMAFFKADDNPCHMWPGPYGIEHAGCRGSYEELYWKRFKAGEDVQRAGSWPGSK